MRFHLIACCALAAILSPAPAIAETKDLGQLDKEKLKQQCAAEGGEWVENGDWFACTKPCQGGECVVICFGEEGCLGSTPERRVSVPVRDDIVAGVLAGSVQQKDSRGTDKEFPWGLFGLLGLAGLLGLRGGPRSVDRRGKPGS